MKNLQVALLEFWESFGVKAFLKGNEKTVPNGAYDYAEMPYITFELCNSGFFEHSVVETKVWTKSESLNPVLEILEKIEKAIPHEGVTLDVEGGAVAFYRATPFIEYCPDENPAYKVGRVRIETVSYIK